MYAEHALSLRYNLLPGYVKTFQVVTHFCLQYVEGHDGTLKSEMDHLLVSDSGI